MKACLRFAALAVFCSSIFAQSRNRFEVVSIKRSAPRSAFHSTLDRAQFVCTGCSLAALIVSAYPEVEREPWKIQAQITWLRDEYWDVRAKLPPDMPTDEALLNRETEEMLRTFLAEGFNLKLHRETRSRPVYALLSAKNGQKLKLSEAAQFTVKRLRDGFEFRHVSMADFVLYLYNPFAGRQATDRPVVDMTGLTGYYDLTLEWMPESVQTPAPDAAPSIYRAIEDLGLKLRPQSALVEFVVIDHADRPETN